MGVTYDLGDGSFSVPEEIKKKICSETVPRPEIEQGSKSVIDLEKEAEIEPEKTANKTKIYRKRRKNKSELDILIEEIAKKNHPRYEALFPTREQFAEFERESELEWMSTDIVRTEYEDDYFAFILCRAIVFTYLYEKEKRQIHYGLKVDRDDYSVTYSITKDNYEAAERLVNGFFTKEEKELIAEKLIPLSMSVYLKYVPNDSIEIGPYDREDIWGAIHVGEAKALNTYFTNEGKMYASFSSWAYICMNNACLDVIHSYSYAKRSKTVKCYSLDEKNGDDKSRDDKSREDGICQDSQQDEIDSIVNTVARTKVIEEIYEEMYKFSESKNIDREIYILKAYSGQLSGYAMNQVQISRMMGLKPKIIAKFLESAKEHFIQATNSLGYTREDIFSLM